MQYYYVKALHLIFVITWFAGLFYIVRLFIYQRESQDNKEPKKSILEEQLKIMSKRLWYIITWPSAILATVFAVWLLIISPSWLKEAWMHVKLVFVFALFLYHFKCHLIYKEQQKSIYKWSATKLRIFNEVATIILFAVVFLVILKSAVNWIWGVIGIMGLGITLMIAIKLYKNYRLKKEE